LIAESTGKRGTGLLPVVGEPLGPPTAYGSDRVFVRLGSSVQAPGPAVAVEFPGPNALGGQFFLWEMTTALLGHMLGVNPFDQPDVESAKDAARKILAAYRSGGEHSTMEAIPLSETSLGAFSSQAAAGNYIAVLAYLDPRPEVTHALSTLRRTLRDRTRCATTLGYGPRYLHSTGQLHKGDAGRGLFLQLVDAPETDVEIPGDIEPSIGFRALVHAQAAGDARALADRGRRVSVLRADDIGTLSGCLI
jgi:transaldolase/glucose-6-phosphate isomerase